MNICQIGEVTWGYEHSLVTMANLILPEDQKLPELFGYFYGKNDTEEKEFKIDTGKNNILDLGSIVKYDNKTHLSTWYDSEEEAGEKTCNRIHGTDGSLFPPYVKENQIFHIFNKDLCRSLPIEYKETVQHFGMDTLRFVPHRLPYLDNYLWQLASSNFVTGPPSLRRTAHASVRLAMLAARPRECSM